MRGIGKTFPGVRALSDVSLTLHAGEVLVLVGENGAGKSTLVKILAGAQPADEGEIFVDGSPVRIDSPYAAERLGIGMIYQEFTLVPQLGAPENIALGAEPMRGPFIDERAVRERAATELKELGLDLPLDVPVSRMSVGQQQLVEIAKALARNARILVMDEPTAALSGREIERLFAIIGRLKATGVGIIYISHRMDELPRIADRVTVLRDGKAVETRIAAEFLRPTKSSTRWLGDKSTRITPSYRRSRPMRRSCSTYAISRASRWFATSRFRCAPVRSSVLPA